MSKPKKTEFSQRETGVEKGEKPEFGTRRRVLCASVATVGLGLLTLFSGCRCNKEKPYTISAEEQRQQACLFVENSNPDPAYPGRLTISYGISESPDCVGPLENYLTRPRFLDYDRYFKVVDLLKKRDPHGVSVILSDKLSEAGISDYVKISIIQKLGEIGDPSAVPKLIEMFFGPNPCLRDAAAGALAKFDDPRAKCVLDGALTNNSEGLRTAAIFGLAEAGDRRMVPLLIEMLTASFPEIEWHEEGLFLGKPKLVPAPIPKYMEIAQMIWLLGELGDARAVPLLTRFISKDIDKPVGHADEMSSYEIHEIARLRAEAAAALGKCAPVGDDAAIFALLDSYSKERFDFARACIIGALARVGDSRALAPLMDALSQDWSSTFYDPEKNGKLLGDVVDGLGRIGDVRAVPVLLSHLLKGHPYYDFPSDNRFDPRNDRYDLFRHEFAAFDMFEICHFDQLTEEVLLALMKFDKDLVVPPMIEKLSDSNEDIQKIAAMALARFRDSRVLPAFIEQFWSPSGCHTAVIYALAKMGDETVAQNMLDALSRRWRQIYAAYVLGNLKDPRAVRPLFELFSSDGFSDARDAAEEALVLIGDARSVASLLSEVPNDYAALRARTIGLLGAMKNPEALPEVAEELYHSYSEVSLAAAWALGEMGDSRAVEPLIRKLGLKNYDLSRPQSELYNFFEDDDLEMLTAVSRALGRIGDHRAIPELTNLKRIIEHGRDYQDERGYYTPMSAAHKAQLIATIEEAINSIQSHASN